jgi:hypothetical protein
MTVDVSVECVTSREGGAPRPQEHLAAGEDEAAMGRLRRLPCLRSLSGCGAQDGGGGIRVSLKAAEGSGSGNWARFHLR